MTESWKTLFTRWVFNLMPVYRGTGGRIAYISHDWRKVYVKIPLSWRTRNYVGTIFGGSMYAAVDPIYMIMLIKILGPDYVVWDKAASIQFKKPGLTTLTAKFQVTETEEEAIKMELETETSIDRIYQVDLIDTNGEVCATVEKTIYIRKK